MVPYGKTLCLNMTIFFYFIDLIQFNKNSNGIPMDFILEHEKFLLRFISKSKCLWITKKFESRLMRGLCKHDMKLCN